MPPIKLLAVQGGFVSNCITVFCNGLAQLECDDFVIDKLYDLVDLIENQTDISGAYDSIFKFMEDNPISDIRSPGPLVHLLEEHFPSYVPKLINSINKAPSTTTISMLHRILNSDVTEPERSQYIDLLSRVSKSDSFNIAVCNEAKEYYDYHC